MPISLYDMFYYDEIDNRYYTNIQNIKQNLKMYPLDDVVLNIVNFNIEYINSYPSVNFN